MKPRDDDPMTDIPWVTSDPTPLPCLTTDQMIEVDRAMAHDYGIELVQMMELAGRHLAHLARTRFLACDVRGRAVVVMAGTGGNGGGALVCARRLATWGARVTVGLAADDGRFTGVPRHQLDIVRGLGLRVCRVASIPLADPPDLVIDGIIGYSLRGAPHGDAAALIEWANGRGAPVLALDLPSGLDATTGQPFAPTIKARATMTLALPKVGLQMVAARSLVGELYLADIGVPPELYARPGLGLAIPDVFATHDLLRLW